MKYDEQAVTTLRFNSIEYSISLEAIVAHIVNKFPAFYGPKLFVATRILS
jgi:hypothetical protein